ncbi:MAG: response regulator [Anaerolineales bacterium]|nr:response regulator [Anaerolineales bacterium]
MKRKILVINDDVALLEAYKQILSLGEYECLLASNNEEARRALSEETLDLIIQDLHRPIEDGIEFYAYLQEKHEYRDIPIIIISAWVPDSISSIGDDPAKRKYRVVLSEISKLSDKHSFPVIIEVEGYLTTPIRSEEVLNLIGSCLES